MSAAEAIYDDEHHDVSLPVPAVDLTLYTRENIETDAFYSFFFLLFSPFTMYRSVLLNTIPAAP